MAGGIVLVMGLPASGKTTLCKAFALNDKTIVWSLDDYPDSGTLRAKNDIIFQLVSNSLAEDPYSIHVIDDTFHLKSMRKRYVLLAKEQRVGLVILNLDAPLDVLLQRNRDRDGRIDDQIIVKMSNYFEPPCPAHKSYLVPSTSQELWNAILNKLAWSKEYHGEIAEIEEIDEVQLQNEAHKLSLLLNQAVSIIMTNTPVFDRENMSRILIPLKQNLFTDLKPRILEDDLILAAIIENNPSYFVSLLQNFLSNM